MATENEKAILDAIEFEAADGELDIEQVLQPIFYTMASSKMTIVQGKNIVSQAKKL